MKRGNLTINQIKEDRFSKTTIEKNILDIKHLVKILEKHIERLDIAHKKKDHLEFNMLKKYVLEFQRKINSLIE